MDTYALNLPPNNYTHEIKSQHAMKQMNQPCHRKIHNEQISIINATSHFIITFHCVAHAISSNETHHLQHSYQLAVAPYVPPPPS